MSDIRLNDELGKKIIEHLKVGNSIEDAALACGVKSKQTVYNWLNQGEKATQGILRRFYEAVQQARAIPDVVTVGKLYENVLRGDQRAIEFYLSRRKKEWQLKQQVDVSGSVQMDMDSFKEKLLSRIAKEAGDDGEA